MKQEVLQVKRNWILYPEITFLASESVVL